MFTRLACVPVALLLAAGPSLAQDPFHDEKQVPIGIGSSAPTLHIATWLKGSPVTSFEKGKIYVIEFWTTWSGACMTSMPHLSALQRKYKGITVIGLSSPDERNELSAVQSMVNRRGEVMDYTVAWDDVRRTRAAYMEAAGRRTIPMVFVVDGAGKLAYIGAPVFLDPPLEQIVAGTWDAKKGNAVVEAATRALDAIPVSTEPDPEAMLARISEFEKSFPQYANLVAVMKFRALLAEGDGPTAYVWASKVVDDAIERTDAAMLNAVAWAIVDPEKHWAKVDLDLAQRAAETCVAFTDGKDGGLLDTLARVWFLKGDVEKAIEIETKALALSSGRIKEDVEKALAEYKSKSGGG